MDLVFKCRIGRLKSLAGKSVSSPEPLCHRGWLLPISTYHPTDPCDATKLGTLVNSHPCWHRVAEEIPTHPSRPTVRSNPRLPTQPLESAQQTKANRLTGEEVVTRFVEAIKAADVDRLMEFDLAQSRGHGHLRPARLQESADHFHRQNPHLNAGGSWEDVRQDVGGVWMAAPGSRKI